MELFKTKADKSYRLQINSRNDFRALLNTAHTPVFADKSGFRYADAIVVPIENDVNDPECWVTDDMLRQELADVEFYTVYLEAGIGDIFDIGEKLIYFPLSKKITDKTEYEALKERLYRFCSNTRPLLDDEVPSLDEAVVVGEHKGKTAVDLFLASIDDEF